VNPLRVGEKTPWVIAHRGASRDHPENTAAAFDAALGFAIDGIELDLQLSRDGIPVVWHDRTLARAGAGRRRVAEIDRDAIRVLSLRAEPILTLDEVLARYGGRTRLLLEIKARPEAEGAVRAVRLIETTAAAVAARRLERSVLLLCFDPAVLTHARRAAPRLPTVLNLRRLPTAKAWPSLDPLFALSVDARALTPRFVREAHERGKPVLTFTCNTSRSVAAARRAGVDAIMSDRPGWLVEVLGS